MSDPTPSISVGVAGWSYPDWMGFVYDKTVRDPLQFLAGYVDMIEINSTFYRPPDARNVASWVKRTAMHPGFFFSAKLHQEITHEHVLSEEMVRAFREGFAPMVERGGLRHLLAQFRYDFRDAQESRDLLLNIRERFAGLGNMVLELRHRSWQEPAALDFLTGLGVSVAHLDYPTAADSFDMDVCRMGEHGYFRLHGRNAAAWFDRKAGRDETYNYQYSAGEREQLADRALRISRCFRSLTVVANNHYEGKEVVNALQLKARLSGGKVPVPPQLLRRYDELKGVADEASLAACRTNETPPLF
ncbi:MAG: hypothetical protein BWY59_00131 [Verrucomicrobia bacterium ADurb.Bin345]|nr:MAG: hypothetical protein BWY59_00131 [Verrucomicrobia bacterium ADurb.Bin345]